MAARPRALPPHAPAPARLLVEEVTPATSRSVDRWRITTRPVIYGRRPPTRAAMSVLRDIGAIAVLAHPHRYRVPRRLAQLTAAFVQEGGPRRAAWPPDPMRRRIASFAPFSSPPPWFGVHDPPCRGIPLAAA